MDSDSQKPKSSTTAWIPKWKKQLLVGPDTSMKSTPGVYSPEPIVVDHLCEIRKEASESIKRSLRVSNFKGEIMFRHIFDSIYKKAKMESHSLLCSTATENIENRIMGFFDYLYKNLYSYIGIIPIDYNKNLLGTFFHSGMETPLSNDKGHVDKKRLSVLIRTLEASHWFAMDILGYTQMDFSIFVKEFYPYIEKKYKVRISVDDILFSQKNGNTACGILFDKNRENILLIEPVYQPLLDMEDPITLYSLPRGKVEIDESPFFSMMEELKEELRIDAPKELECVYRFDLKRQKRTYKIGGKSEKLFHCYVFDDVDIEIEKLNGVLQYEMENKIQFCVENKRVYWVPVDELRNNLHRKKYSGMADILECVFMWMDSSAPKR